MRALVACTVFCGFLIAIMAQPQAATIEPARTVDGKIVAGVKIEGEIIEGDAGRLLKYYQAYGPAGSATVYLRSRGGDVEEAMKLGLIIRRLYLATDAPYLDAGKPAISAIPSADPDNMICASACFLIYAAGIDRQGNAVGLHRPHLPKETVNSISNQAFISEEKIEIEKIRNYLTDMTIGPYWIDIFLHTNSNGLYVPTLGEAGTRIHAIIGAIPSIEELLLARCPGHTQEIQTLIDGPLGDKDSQDRRNTALEQFLNKDRECREIQIGLLQSDAFNNLIRDHVTLMCKFSGFSESDPGTGFPDCLARNDLHLYMGASIDFCHLDIGARCPDIRNYIDKPAPRPAEANAGSGVPVRENPFDQINDDGTVRPGGLLPEDCVGPYPPNASDKH